MNKTTLQDVDKLGFNNSFSTDKLLCNYRLKVNSYYYYYWMSEHFLNDTLAHNRLFSAIKLDED